MAVGTGVNVAVGTGANVAVGTNFTVAVGVGFTVAVETRFTVVVEEGANVVAGVGFVVAVGEGTSVAITVFVAEGFVPKSANTPLEESNTLKEPAISIIARTTLPPAPAMCVLLTRADTYVTRETIASIEGNSGSQPSLGCFAANGSVRSEVREFFTDGCRSDFCCARMRSMLKMRRSTSCLK